MLNPLSQLCPGDRGIIQKMDVPAALGQRLKDFGFVPGTNVQCCYYGPGRKMAAVGCRGCVLALRTRDLRSILVSAHG